MNGLLEAGPRAELADQLDWGAHLIERRDLQDARHRRGRRRPSSWYFCEQRVEDGARLGAVLREHVALADVVRPLPAGQRRLAVGDMADEIERVEVGVDLVGERLEPEPLLFELVDDRLLAIRALPPPEEGVERREAGSSPLSSSSPAGSR